MSTSAGRMAASERREAIVAVALEEFAATGYVGTSAETIAQRVGVTQPYVFHLFKTKKALFLATVRACFGRTRQLFEDAGARARLGNEDPSQVLNALAGACRRQLDHRDLLRLQLQAYAACDDDDIRAVVTEEMRAVYRLAARLSGADAAALEAWFATGMVLTVMAAISPPGANSLSGWIAESTDESKENGCDG